jgi:hypothetical protein
MPSQSEENQSASEAGARQLASSPTDRSFGVPRLRGRLKAELRTGSCSKTQWFARPSGRRGATAEFSLGQRPRKSPAQPNRPGRDGGGARKNNGLSGSTLPPYIRRTIGRTKPDLFAKRTHFCDFWKIHNKFNSNMLCKTSVGVFNSEFEKRTHFRRNLRCNILASK